MRHPVILILCFICLSVAQAQKDFSEDVKIGQAAALKIEKQVGLVHVSQAEATVRRVGTRLVSNLSQNPFSFTFNIVDQAEPNAFALPGGFVYVSRGLLALLKNEDELAGVLGHEISHVTQRHGVKSKRKAILPAILAIPGVIVGGTIGGELGSAIAAPMLGAGKIILASYSRKQEAEADDLGIALAAKSGYQPLKLADILNRIEQYVTLEYGHASKSSLFNDHPMTPERMTDIQKRGSLLTATPSGTPATTFDFLSSFNQVMYGHDPQKGTFNDNIFLHPKLKIYWELPKGWKYFNESSIVGASKDEETTVVMTIAGRASRIDTLIENFVNRYYSATRKKPIADTSLPMKGREGSEVILPGKVSGQILYSLWFKKDEYTYVILATGPQDQRSLFEDISKTFRDLAEADHPLIHQMELMTVRTIPGETVESLNKRTRNVLNQKTTELINGVGDAVTFGEGDPVKVVVTRPFIVDKPVHRD